MTLDEAGILERPDLPDAFERWELVLPGRTVRTTSPAEWAGALVAVREGTFEVGCRAGGHETFQAGDLLALGWLPIVELRNHGDGPVRLIAVRRRGPRPVQRYLHVRRGPSQANTPEVR